MHAETLLKFIFLLIVLGLLWGVSEWLVRSKKGFYQNKGNAFLKRLDVLALGAQHNLQLIKIGENKIILLAISPTRTDIIMQLEEAELEPSKGEQA